MPDKPDFKPLPPSVGQQLKRMQAQLDALGLPLPGIEQRLAIIEAQLGGNGRGRPHTRQHQATASYNLVSSVADLSQRVTAIEKHLGLHQTIKA